MPRSYRIIVTMEDEDGNEVATETHDETFEDDQEAIQKFQQKQRAARSAGKGQQR